MLWSLWVLQAVLVSLGYALAVISLIRECSSRHRNKESRQGRGGWSKWGGLREDLGPRGILGWPAQEAEGGAPSCRLSGLRLIMGIHSRYMGVILVIIICSDNNLITLAGPLSTRGQGQRGATHLYRHLMEVLCSSKYRHTNQQALMLKVCHIRQSL